MKEKNIMYIVIAVIAVILLYTLYKPIKVSQRSKATTKVGTSRGYRNSNPGNIIKTYRDVNGRKQQTFWNGEIIGDDKRFKTFKSMEWGYRAIFILLNSYINNGFDTIDKIINRYAPSFENNTRSYVKHVSEMTGIDSNTKLSMDDTDDIIKIVGAISKIENGIVPDQNEIEEGYKLYKSK